MGLPPSHDVALRVLEPSDAADLLDLRLRNRRHFAPTEPLRDDDWLTLRRQVGVLDWTDQEIWAITTEDQIRTAPVH